MRDDVVERALQEEESRVALIGEMTAQELHAFLGEYNWDNGFEPVWAIIQNPECELATALLAFWLADPDLSTVPPAASRYENHTKFVAELFDRITSGRYGVGRLPYNPNEFIMNRLQRVKLERSGLPSVFLEQLPKIGT